jgi:hypothetical protein
VDIDGEQEDDVMSTKRHDDAALLLLLCQFFNKYNIISIVPAQHSIHSITED